MSSRQARLHNGEPLEKLDHDDALRQGLRRYRTKSTLFALMVFLVDASAYTAGFLCLTTVTWPIVLKLPLSILMGVLITRLAIIGHDAAHGSLTASKGLNAVLGRIALLPGLHAFSLWQVGHNRVHHTFTNLKGLDFIWIPLSPDEYRALPRRRRWLERLYRSTLGFGMYYLVEIWWKYLSPQGLRSLRPRRAVYSFDLLLVFGFLALEVLAARGAILEAVFIPFLVWNWLMGFIIFNHHTHPSARFFKNRSEWRFFEAQVQGTVHVVFPIGIGYLLNQIMEHTAHHFDVNIPFYRLRAAQRFIEQQLNGALIVEKWSGRRFLETCRACQLYDYDRHCWATFADATRSSESLTR
jgi:omega-6 fatty acid desaturase (delta-12 desaturase)